MLPDDPRTRTWARIRLRPVDVPSTRFVLIVLVI
jgi:hypothetical protein